MKPGFDMRREFDGLESAEDFLDYFGIEFDRQVVAVNRLHILQRFHDYLENGANESSPPSYGECRARLARAYEDFVRSDAMTERVFRVHRRAAGIACVPLSAIKRGGRK